jgi:hypothetical protein
LSRLSGKNFSQLSRLSGKFFSVVKAEWEKFFPVVKAEWEKFFPLSLYNGRSPHGYINQRLQIQFRAPDDERCAIRNMLSLQ